MFVVSADRISTDLHNLVVLMTNPVAGEAADPDYLLNDPDPAHITIPGMNNIYGRSDHYSARRSGIPIAFFFTGLHADYHRLTDHVDKINFPKSGTVGQLVYEIGSGRQHGQNPRAGQ